MFSRTNTKENPWIVVMADSKINARVESMKYILEQIPYAGKSENLEWNRNVIVQI
jgi:polyphosphate kinase 2 (PPK2 family)